MMTPLPAQMHALLQPPPGTTTKLLPTSTAQPEDPAADPTGDSTQYGFLQQQQLQQQGQQQ